MTDTASLPPRRPLWLVILPVGLVLIAAAGWTALWFYAAARAQTEIEAWIAAEAGQGRQWSCAERRFAGFPFRFELICTEPKLVFSVPASAAAGAAAGTSWTATARRAHAVAQIWDPQHVIAEFESPSSLVEATSGRRLDATWSLLQTSAVGAKGRLERVSIAANDYALGESGSALFAARHFELHVRHHPGDDGPTLDIAAGMDGGTGPASVADKHPPVDGELQATITAVPEFRSMPPAERLRLWQQAGGRLKLVLARLTAGDSVLMSSGEVGLDDRGRPNGQAQLTIAGSDKLLSALSTSGLLPPVVAGLAPMLLSAGQPVEVDGRKGSSFPFTFRDGKVSMGFIPLGKIGSLY